MNPNLPPDRSRFDPLSLRRTRGEVRGEGCALTPPPSIERIDLLLGLYARLLPGSAHRPELLAHCDQLLDQRNALCHDRTEAPLQSATRNPQSKIP